MSPVMPLSEGLPDWHFPDIGGPAEHPCAPRSLARLDLIGRLLRAPPRGALRNPAYA